MHDWKTKIKDVLKRFSWDMLIKLFENVIPFPEEISEETRIPKRWNDTNFPQALGQRGIPFFPDRPEFLYSVF